MRLLRRRQAVLGPAAVTEEAQRVARPLVDAELRVAAGAVAALEAAPGDRMAAGYMVFRRGTGRSNSARAGL